MSTAILTDKPAVINPRLEFVNSLRELADFYEANEAIPLPCYGKEMGAVLPINEDQRIKALRQLGTFEKQFTDDMFTAVRKFGLLTLELFAQRQRVCVRKVVGTRQIPERVIPAQPEQVVPAHEEEIVEWDCQPVLDGGQ